MSVMSVAINYLDYLAYENSIQSDCAKLSHIALVHSYSLSSACHWFKFRFDGDQVFLKKKNEKYVFIFLRFEFF
jgi:hypothetical protein